MRTMTRVTSMSTTALPADNPLDPNSAALGEQAWIEVIQKMDEVYNDLLQYEVALEDKNAALEESQQFIESVLAAMSDILIACDRHGVIVEVNPSLCHFAGKTAAELEGRPLYDLFADNTEQARAREVFARFGKDGVHDQEFFLRAGDGSTVPVSMNCTPRISQTGKLMGMVVTGRPVGELRKAYQALRQAHDDLKRTQGQLLHAEKMISLGRLVAGVAHELNNPISFVLGNVLSLKRYAQRLEGYLNAVHATAAHQMPERQWESEGGPVGEPGLGRDSCDFQGNEQGLSDHRRRRVSARPTREYQRGHRTLGALGRPEKLESSGRSPVDCTRFAAASFDWLRASMARASESLHCQAILLCGRS